MFGRRRFGLRRPSYRRFGLKRRRMARRVPRVPRTGKPFRAAAAAAVDNRTSVKMCKDLGALWPGCVVIKLKYNFLDYVGGSAAGSASNSPGYQGAITAYPFQPLVTAGQNFTSGNSLAYDTHAGSPLTSAPASALGWAKVIGAAGGTGLYLRACTICMQYNLKLHLVTSLPGAASSNAPGEVTVTARAYSRPYDSTESPLQSLYTALGDEYKMDANLAQPNVKRAPVRNSSGYVSFDGFASGPMAKSTYPIASFRGKVWPHRTLDVSWSNYISSDTSFGPYNGLPQDYARLELGARIHQFTTSTTTTTNQNILCYPFLEGSLVFTMLLKDPVSNAAT